MNCPKCPGHNTILRSKNIWTTTAYRYPFRDSKGFLHHHILEINVIEYLCSNGHSFTNRHQKKCWCGWPHTTGD